MTAEERALVMVTARLLRAAAYLRWLAAGLTIVAAAATVHGYRPVRGTAALVLGLVALFYGIRVSFDAKLLEDIAADRLKTAQLDHALSTIRKGTVDRTWDDRCRGARRLVALCGAATLAQVLAIALIRWP